MSARSKKILNLVENKENTMSLANKTLNKTYRESEPLLDDSQNNIPSLDSKTENNVIGPSETVEKSSNLDINKTVVQFGAIENSCAIKTNDSNDKHKPSACPVVTAFSFPGTSQSNDVYKIQSRSSTKVNLRKVKQSYTESFSDKEDFSSGSSDNYNPDLSCSSSEANSSSDSEPENSNTLLTEEVINPPVKGKKRVRNEDNWKKIKNKRLKNLGKEYTSKTGQPVRAKYIKSPCPNKCILSCSKKISEEYRKQLFDDYWKLGSFQRQRDFLGSCIEQLTLKYRRISAATPRNPNSAFYVFNDGKKIRICKTFLINTLGISEKTIRTVIRSKVSGKGVVAEDLRGRHNKHRRIDEEIANSVREHINSVPRVDSHYVRSGTSREFVDGGLSIAELHRNYSDGRKASNKPVATYDYYAKIFNTEFNMGFHSPKKDQCDLCESYKNASDNEKNKLENDYQVHLAEKILSLEEKENDKQSQKSGEICLAVYDLQAVLPVPVGPTSAFFYKSRLNCYNFTVTEIGNDKTKSFFWHEGLANRGAIEIGTCVLIYLEELSKIRPGVDVVFFSDNCGGQQKNRFLIAAYLFAVEKYQIRSITHKYLIRGHTQNEGDAIHSIIEKSLKKAKKSGPIYVPEQYISIIRN